MNAVILAGGFGSRLQPLTDSQPKPLLPIANVPMLDYCCAHLASCGIRDVVLTLGYRADDIITHVTGLDLCAHYCIEDTPLGTAGGVKAAQSQLHDRFIVLSGDALENIDFDRMTHVHARSGALVTMAVTHVRDPHAFGLVRQDPHGKVTALIEKPDGLPDGDYTINCGIYVMERAVLDFVRPNVKYDFSRDLFPRLIARGLVQAFEHDGYWSDIGTPHAYYAANFDLLHGGFFPPLLHPERDVSVRCGAEGSSLVSFSANVTGHVYRSIVGQGASVCSGAVLHDCIVLPHGTAVGPHSREIIGKDFVLPIADAPFSADLAKSAQIRPNA